MPVLTGEGSAVGNRMFSLAKSASGNYLYTLDDTGDVDGTVSGYYLRIWDISDPSLPEQVGLIESGDGNVNPTGMTVVGSHVFAFENDKILRDYDVSDPAHPLLVDEQPS